MPPAEPIYEASVRFEGFTIDRQRRGLYRGNERVHLTPIPFKVLEFLVLKRGSVVSKDELLSAVWGGHRDENTVEQSIRQIRRALGDEKDQPRFIQTIPGVGYSFISKTTDGDRSPVGPEFVPLSKPTDSGLSGEMRFRKIARRAVVLSAIAAGLLLAVVAFLKRPSRLTVANPIKITRSETVVLSPLLSDGSQIYYPQYDYGRYAVARIRATGGEGVSVATGIPNPELCDLSPDGSAMLLRNLIHSRNDDEPLYVRFKGRPAQRLGNIFAYDATWYPDAKHILYSADGVVYSTDLTGGSVRQLFEVPGNAFWFRWSPDASRLRFTVIDKNSEATSIWEVSAGGGEPRRLFPELPYHLCCGTWTPDGKFFLFQARIEDAFQIWAQQEKRKFLVFRLHDRPFPLVSGAMSYRGPLVSEDGRKLFLRAEDPKGELVRYDPRAGEFIPLLPSLSVRTLAFSNDGKWIAYTGLTDYNLWRCRADGTDCLQITQGFKNTLMPRWSPNGHSIAFMGLRFTGEWGIYVAPAVGGSVRSVITENQAEGYPDWSPDGTRLVFSEVIPVAHPEGVHVLDLSTGRISTLPGSGNFFLPRWSPDGRLIVALHAGDNYPFLFDFANSTWRPLANVEGGYPNWSRDGKHVYFLSKAGGNRTVFRVSIANRRLEKVADLENVEPTPFILGDWMGLAPDDSPLAVQDMTTDDIYAWSLTAK